MLWLIAVLGFAAMLMRAHRNTHHPEINNVAVAVKATGRVDKNALSDLRILHLSDLHMENLSVSAERVVDEMRGQELDLIAITGDLLDRARNIPRAVAYVEALKKLKPKHGIYVTFGNHDYVLKANKLAHLKIGLERIGAHVLVNETMTVDHNGVKLHIIGIDDFATRHHNLAKSYKKVDDEGIRLVLTHDPNIVLHMKEYDYDYLLSGHFHGGQIHWPKPFHLAKMGKLPRMNIIKGLHFRDGRPFYISEGLGQTGVNIRLRSRPEITLHTLGAAGATEGALGTVAVAFEPVKQEAAPTLAASEV
ncbi:metallophosphoesterase [Brevibacillus dissolubilis]|uniref:metallophosphoesterase n=1 Tax=Brevibacillus dissolubilis TaxID=1844116 RepID=UPI0011164EC2|nr:metallophosphoesterase [Brevibacillus dissolubilis]